MTDKKKKVLPKKATEPKTAAQLLKEAETTHKLKKEELSSPSRVVNKETTKAPAPKEKATAAPVGSLKWKYDDEGLTAKEKKGRRVKLRKEYKKLQEAVEASNDSTRSAAQKALAEFEKKNRV